MRVRVSGCVLVLLLLGGLPVAADVLGMNALWSCTTLSEDRWAIFNQEAERAHMLLAGRDVVTPAVYWGSGSSEGETIIFWTHLTMRLPIWRDGRNGFTIPRDWNTKGGRMVCRRPFRWSGLRGA